MDIKCLPQMSDESERRCLFVAIDRATRWVFMRICGNQSETSSVDFLNRLERAAPMKICKLFTDNGSQFTDCFTSKKPEPSGRRKFDARCKAVGIEHRLCPPRHPQTNGMLERFFGRVPGPVRLRRFAAVVELETTFGNCMKTYNHLIPQRELNHLPPVQALKGWQMRRPKLFVERVCKQPGLDNYCSAGQRSSLLLRRDGSDTHLHCEAGVALGVMEDMPYQHQQITLAPDDTLVQHTDGVLRAFAPAGTPFGDDGVAQALAFDDITLPALKYHGASEAATPATAAARS